MFFMIYMKNMNADLIKKRFDFISPFLNERMRRIFAATEARALGRGGTSLVAKLTGVSRRAINEGVKELSQPQKKQDINQKRSRKPGGGRKKTIEKDPALKKDLENLIEPFTRGDPMSPLLWTCKSVRNLSNELNRLGHKTSHRMIAEMLSDMKYSLQGNKKTIEGGSHVDRNAQFEYISKKAKEFQRQFQPVISVDTKKKELVGNFKNNGKEWRPEGNPEKVNVYDFINENGKANPYGIFDVTNNLGYVNVGTDHDTSAFAVESIRRWWNLMGKEIYPSAKKLFITADGGGSNGWRVKLWKKELQKFSNETKLEVHVSHLPPGTSKWNKIEHRLFSFISMNWRGKPLTTHEVIVNLIANTTTAEGLKVKCQLDKNVYQTGIKISKNEMSKINIHVDAFHGEWNYAICPVL